MLHLPLTVIIKLSELLASLKPVTDTEQVYCPLSESSGTKLIVLVNCNSSSTVILSLDSNDAESSLSQLTITSDDDTPLTSVTVQYRVWFSPLTDPSSDCDTMTNACGTKHAKCIHN